MQTINLNEDQREKFGEMQVQFQGLRKQLSSVVAQVIRWRSMLALRAHSRGSHREKNKVVLLMSDGTVRASTIESASARGRETACYFLGGGALSLVWESERNESGWAMKAFASGADPPICWVVSLLWFGSDRECVANSSACSRRIDIGVIL